MHCTVSESDSEELKRHVPALSERLAVPMMFTLYVVTKALDRVFIYRVQKSMASYSTILMSIYWPPGVCIACFLFLFCLQGVKSLGDGSNPLSWFSPFYVGASAQGPVPQTWFMLIAFLDQINATFSAAPSPFIPAVLHTPLNNSVVFWTAIIAYFYLGTRFKAVHYAGIALVLISCVVGVMVELQGPPDVVCTGLQTATETLQDPNLPVPSQARWEVGNATEKCARGLPPYKDANGKIVFFPFSTLAPMYLLFFATLLPYAFVNVYKQKKLKQVDLDVAYGFFWQTVWQVVSGLLFVPATWIPWPTPAGRNEAIASNFGESLADSWTCFLGRNPKPHIRTCSAEPAWAWFSIYLLFNVFFNLCLMWLIKRMSSTWAATGSILCRNLGGFFSQFQIFGGKSAQVLSMEQWMALILSTMAMWIYNIEARVSCCSQNRVHDSI